MAFVTGTATTPQQLYDALLSFLRTNSDLIAAGEQWQLAWQDSDSSDIVLRGPGLSGQDQIYVGFRLVQQPDLDAYWIELHGMTGVLANAENVRQHVNVTPAAVRMFVDEETMQYWFVANGRRFVAVVKISTVFQACYGGFIIPFATPLSYGYPVFIGGSTGPEDSTGPANWRSEDNQHSHFVSPAYGTTPTDTVLPGAYLLDPAGQWLYVANRMNGSDGQVGLLPEFGFDAFGFADGGSYRYGMNALRIRLRECFGGHYPLLPITAVQKLPGDQTYGILDGCYRCQGFGNAAENLIALDGVNHLVVQNTFRSTIGEYWALRLE